MRDRMPQPKETRADFYAEAWKRETRAGRVQAFKESVQAASLLVASSTIGSSIAIAVAHMLGVL